MENNKKRKKTDSFVAVEHHVKSPIFILRGYLESLFDEDLGELNEKQKKYINVCIENTKKIGYIIESLLKIVAIEEGEHKIEKEKVDVVRAVEEAIGKNIFLARASNMKMFFSTKEGEVFVIADKEKIKNIFDSFLVNAIKYKKEGEGRVEIFVEKKEKEVVCTVKDNGVGVVEEDKEKIFHKFYRTEKAIELDPNSLGVELYANKRVVESCGGKMWVEDNEHGGATFVFTLPLA